MLKKDFICNRTKFIYVCDCKESKGKCIELKGTHNKRLTKVNDEGLCCFCKHYAQKKFVTPDWTPNQPIFKVASSTDRWNYDFRNRIDTRFIYG